MIFTCEQMFVLSFMHYRFRNSGQPRFYFNFFTVPPSHRLHFSSSIAAHEPPVFCSALWSTSSYHPSSSFSWSQETRYLEARKSFLYHFYCQFIFYSFSATTFAIKDIRPLLDSSDVCYSVCNSIVPPTDGFIRFIYTTGCYLSHRPNTVPQYHLIAASQTLRQRQQLSVYFFIGKTCSQICFDAHWPHSHPNGQLPFNIPTPAPASTTFDDVIANHIGKQQQHNHRNVRRSRGIYHHHHQYNYHGTITVNSDTGRTMNTFLTTS